MKAKTKKTLIWVIIIIIILIALSIGGFFIFKKKDKTKNGNEKSASGNGANGSSGTQPTTTPANDVKAEYTLGYISERLGDANYNFVPCFDYPRPPAGTINKDNKVRLVGVGKYSGEYTVEGTWKDAHGNLGALYLNSPNVTTTNSTNRTWQGKGKIQLLK